MDTCSCLPSRPMCPHCPWSSIWHSHSSFPRSYLNNFVRIPSFAYPASTFLNGKLYLCILKSIANMESVVRVVNVVSKCREFRKCHECFKCCECGKCCDCHKGHECLKCCLCREFRKCCECQECSQEHEISLPDLSHSCVP